MQHPDFNARCKKINTIAILPPNAQVVQVNFGGVEQFLPGKQRRVSEDLVNLIADELRKRGFSASRIDHNTLSKLNSTKLFDDAELAKFYSNVFDELANSKEINGNQEIECSFEERVSQISTFTKSDALFFIFFKGYKMNAGSAAGEFGQVVMFIILTGGMLVPTKDPSGYEQLQAKLVESKTGDVLWTNRVTDVSYGYIPPDFDKASLKDLVEDLFEGFPK